MKGLFRIYNLHIITISETEDQANEVETIIMKLTKQNFTELKKEVGLQTKKAHWYL